MKKRTVQFLGLIEILILLSALTLFALQNPNTLTLFLNYATKQLDLSYSDVSGNLLKNIKVKNITYHNKLLTKEAIIDWNLKALLTASLKIDEISIKKLNIPLTQEWIEHLRQKFSTKSKNSKIKEIPTIEISQVFFSAMPFSNKTITVKRVELQANNLKGDLSHIDIGFFSFLTQSNYANITAIGNMHKNILSFEKLWLEEIDIPKIRTLIKTQQHQENSAKEEKDISAQKFIKELLIDNLIIYIKPLHYKHYQIDKSVVTIRELKTNNLRKFNASHVYIDATTNMWELSSSGKITNNRLYTQIDLNLNDKYFKRFVPFFDHTQIKPVHVDLTVDKTGLSGDLFLKTGNLLIKKYRDINASVPQLNAHVDFNFSNLQMQGEINASINSIYTTRSKLNGHIYYQKEKGFFYDGNLKIPQTKNLPKAICALLYNNDINFSGDSKKVIATLNNKYLTAQYDAKSYIDANLHLQSKNLKADIFTKEIPKFLTPLEMTFNADIPIHYKKFFPLQPRYGLHSNMLDLNGTASLGKTIKTKALIKKTKNSYLDKLLPNLKQKTVFPANFSLSYANSHAEAELKNKILTLHANHNFNNSYTEISLNNTIHPLLLKGNIAKDFNLTFHTPSIREFQDQAAKLYRFDKLPMDGDVNIEARIQNISVIDADIEGKWFVYEYKPNRFLFGEKINMAINFTKNRLSLKKYRFNTYLDRDRHFFSNKSSTAHFRKNKIFIDSFYLNNAALIQGSYDYKQQKGFFKTTSKNYHYNDIEGNIYFDANFELSLSPDNTDIEGELIINKGTITYAPKKERYVQDDDIIVIQEQKRIPEEQDKLSLNISIITKKPIYYRIPNTNVKLKADIKIWKQMQKNLELLGIIKVLNGIYTQSGKEFELEPGEILFGGNPLNPYLNIRAIHHTEPYTIYVNITGQMDAPVINFSATPYLTQSDILSLLLFNSTTNELLSGNQDTSKTAISMFGTVFAKEIVQNFGIKLDKLVLTTTEEGKLGVELGKKLSRKVTLIYINDIVQTIKVRYKLSDHFETDFIFSPDNSGVDIIYKDEY